MKRHTESIQSKQTTTMIQFQFNARDRFSFRSVLISRASATSEFHSGDCTDWLMDRCINQRLPHKSYCLQLYTQSAVIGTRVSRDSFEKKHWMAYKSHAIVIVIGMGDFQLFPNDNKSNYGATNTSDRRVPTRIAHNGRLQVKIESNAFRARHYVQRVTVSSVWRETHPSGAASTARHIDWSCRQPTTTRWIILTWF